MFSCSDGIEDQERKMSFNIGIGFVVVFALVLYGVGTWILKSK